MTKLKSSQAVPQQVYCRICLQSFFPIKKLPCKCKGSLSYMHDTCFNQMLHVKIQNQKEDASDYVLGFSNHEENDETVKVKCEICLQEITTEKKSKLSWEKLMEVKMQIYFVLFWLTCLCFFGLKIGLTLLEKALYDTNIIARSLYFGAYVWIMGVILYVLIEPLYTEVKVIKFKIKCQEIKPPKKLKRKFSLPKSEKKNKPNESNLSNDTMKLKQCELLQLQNLRMMRRLQKDDRKINKCKDKQIVNVKYYSKQKDRKCIYGEFNLKKSKINYFEI